jgi:hypothetical protein
MAMQHAEERLGEPRFLVTAQLTSQVGLPLNRRPPVPGVSTWVGAIIMIFSGIHVGSNSLKYVASIMRL